MCKKAALAKILCLLILTISCAAEISEQDRVVKILHIAKEIDATQEQIANAIASGITPEEFLTQAMSKIRLIAPDKAPKGSPVQISVEGMPDKAAEVWSRYPQYPSDVWLELFDRSGNPVNVFWSSDQGPRTFELIVAENGPEVPTVEIATHNMQYGEGPGPIPGPTPLPFPEPPTPSSTLQTKVQPIISLMKDADPSDLLNLSEFYFDFADVIRRDGGNIVKTTADFRNTYINAGNLMFQQTGIKGKYAGLPEIVDGIISDHIGLDVIPLDASKTANILNAVAWGFYQPLKEE